MWKYIITWTISVWVSEPCPDSKPDQFGRQQLASCGVLHGRLQNTRKCKEFTDKKEFEEFYDAINTEMSNGSTFTVWNGISEVKIDSVKIEK